MRKQLFSLCLVLLTLTWSVPVLAAAETTVPITLNGFDLALAHPALSRNGVSEVPVEEFLRAVGGDVQTAPWDSAPLPGGVLYRWAEDGSSVMTVHWYDKTLTLTPGLDGVSFRDGILYAPLRPLAEGLGLTVLWDGNGSMVALSYPKKEVYVESLEGLFNAVAPDTTITLAQEKYSFANLDVEKINNPYVYVDYEVFDTSVGEWNTGTVYQLVIQNVRDLRICTSNNPEPTRVATPWAYADVWNFQNCRRVVMEGGLAVHDVEPGYCTGNCVELEDCRDILLSNVIMDGSGAYGLNASSSQHVFLSSCTIQHCTYGAVNLWDSKDVTLNACRVQDNKGCFSLIGVSDSSDTRLIRCDITGNSASALVDNYGSQNVVFEGCSFGVNAFGLINGYGWQSSGGAVFLDCEGLERLTAS